MRALEAVPSFAVDRPAWRAARFEPRAPAIRVPASERLHASKQQTRQRGAYLAAPVLADDALEHVLWRLVRFAVRPLRLQQFEQCLLGGEPTARN